jgi:uncharacterized protein (DUF1501 family)
MNTNFLGGFGSSTSRREFLQVTGSSLGSVALAGMPWIGNVLRTSRKSVLFVYLAGGPSQLDMYDMKPEAPADIRGEFRPINTNVPGVRVCELLPLHAKIADKFAIVNGVETIDTHSAAVVTTGCAADRRQPSVGEISSVQIQTPTLPHGDWDTHGRVLGGQLSIFEELREKLPVYDRMIYELVTGIYERGLDKDVLVVVCGEFGRTPWINEYGGRNHWATSGSVLFAGGGLRMGQVIGDTGPIGERERMRGTPYTAQNVLAMVYRHLEIDPPKILDGCRVIEELI